MRENLSKAEKRFLYFIYVFRCVDRKLLRLYGGDYDNSGKKVARLIERGLVEERIFKRRYYHKEKVLMLTKEGLNLAQTLFPEFSKEIDKERKKYTGVNNNYDALKVSSAFLMMTDIFPNIFFQYINSRFGSHRYDSLETFIEHNKNPNGDYVLFFKELSRLFPDEIKKMGGKRAVGILRNSNGAFVIYNHNRKKMKARGQGEEKAFDFTSVITGDTFPKSIHFAKSYKCAIDTIKSVGSRNQDISDEILLSGLYRSTYYVPMHRHGKEQLVLYFIKNCREKIQEKILLPNEIERGRNAIYDGESDSGEVIYLGFECDIWEIMKLLNLLRLTMRNKTVKIYCFDHQVDFYRKAFSEFNIKIKKLPVSQVINEIK